MSCTLNWRHFNSINNPLSLLFEGDSITAGSYPNPSNYPTLTVTAVSALTTYMHQTNNAVNGSLIADLNTRAATDDAFLTPHQRTSVISVLEGHNDIITGIGSVPAFETAITSYCQARRAAGWKVVISTLLPSTISGFNAGRNSFNTWLAANYTTFADALADPASDPTIGCDACAANLTYYVDGTHPTAAAGPILDTYFINAIESLLPTN